MSLYLAVELFALAIPLAFSFDRKVAYFRMWPFILPALLVNSMIFISIDIYFTSKGVWGFNPDFHSGIIIAGLPLEELLFFIIIPYCSLFVHYVFIAYLPEISVRPRAANIIYAILAFVLIVVAILNREKLYTSIYSLLTAGVLTFSRITFPFVLSRFYITFLIILVPFLVVNSILTGSFIDGEVFWYNHDEISGIKLFTIPVEDILFGFSLVLLNLVFSESIRKLIKR